MLPQQETVFYQDASPVFISSLKAVFFEQTFVIKNIVSVSVGRVKYYYINEGFFLLLGLALFFWGIRTPMSETTLIFALVGFGLISLIIGAVLMIIAVRNPHYALLIGSAGGQVEAATSKDKQYIGVLASAVNAALTYQPR